MSEISIVAVEHQMTRLNIRTGIQFDEFVAAFEREAPAFDPAPFFSVLEAGGGWDQIEAVMAEFAPHDLAVYARIDARPLVEVAGLSVQAIEYLLGNHVIATSMFRHEPNVMLYAPLRVLIFSDTGDQAVVAIDRPSTVFTGLGNADIAATGVLLDSKVAGLLRVLGVDVTDELA